jgi:integration host factor subunit alpha
MASGSGVSHRSPREQEKLNRLGAACDLLKGESVMAGDTVTRARLAEVVYQAIGLPRNAAAELVGSVIAEISDALDRGEIVRISSFGSFAVRRKGQRIGRNPRTGQEVPISPRRVLVFRASPTLKRSVDRARTKAG